jgi:adenine-specific DNA-methyltransferase
MTDNVDPWSLDVAEERRRALLELIPEIRSEGGNGVDVDKLRALLGEEQAAGKEPFGMSWPGKRDAIRAAQTQSVATLRPVREESVDFDTTGNVIIEGDNLEVLKLLQKSYLGKVKMIYIDPPYNTGNDFVYPDNYSESLQTYLEYTGQVDAEGRRFSTNTETDGRFHSRWMSMMYPRLVLARNLLADDGVMFVSIDDHELPRLSLLLDEVFGEEERLGTVTVVNNWKGRSDAHGFASCHDYLVVYARKAFASRGIELSDEVRETYRYADEQGRSYRLLPLRKSGHNSRRSDSPSSFFALYVDPSTRQVSLEPRHGLVEVLPRFPNGEDGCWRWGRQTATQRSSDLVGVDVAGRGWDVYAKDYLERDGDQRRAPVKSTWKDPQFSSDAGTAMVKDLLGPRVFDSPKPVGLIMQVLEMSTSGGDIILDFFAGSGTTAHAVMNQNAKDGGTRRFVLVQLPEAVEQDSPAGEAGYRTIADITRERVRRAANRVLEGANDIAGLNSQDGAGQLDVGFRSFKLDRSNFQVWDAMGAQGDAAKLHEQLKLQEEHVLAGRSGLDVVFEVLLKSKYPLTTKVAQERLGSGEIWAVDDGRLIVVVDEGIALAEMRSLATRDPKPATVVILDRCLTDSLKANARKIFEDAGVEFKTI